ncbi:putative fatty acyl-CoA reductase CG5065 [Bombyx mandarina]|uniref:Fatty acyl-CoA reductase n=1 Tax=Bombyx mandarina TaxID=7092 RepID=A0A6J2JRF5_BOMMA|nr:putative fatty acyl-CoA reductase CG5065 [Bombyx mandarina]
MTGLITHGLFLQNNFLLNFNKNNIKLLTNNFSTSYICANIDRHDNAPKKSISEFYSGKSVLVTGGTGFLGKVLVEKLLYDTDVEKLYLMIREKDGETIDRRMAALLNNSIFGKLKALKPSAVNKIVPIYGDVTQTDLAMKTQDIKTLTSEVSVVFHMAASIQFKEPMSVTLNYNYEGTKRVLKLLRQMQKIESFVHVSSVYAQALDGGKIVQETLYPPPANHNELETFISKYDNDEEETKKFLQRRCNTYAYGKALTEAFVAENHGTIPTCIVRPSMITSKAEQPLPGWLDNWYGPTRFLYNASRGWDRSCFIRREFLADMIPVDYVANLCIVAGARNDSCVDIAVFNSCTTGANPLTWAYAHKCMIKDTVKNKLNDLPYPFVLYTQSKLLYSIYTMLLQLIPAKIADGWLWVTGRRSKYTKTQKKVIHLKETLSFFLKNSWVIECENTRKLFRSLSLDDQKKFPCDPVNINWRKYLEDYQKGIEKFLCQEKVGPNKP